MGFGDEAGFAALEGAEMMFEGAHGGCAEAVGAHFFGEGKEAVGHGAGVWRGRAAGATGEAGAGRGGERERRRVGKTACKVGTGAPG